MCRGTAGRSRRGRSQGGPTGSATALTHTDPDFRTAGAGSSSASLVRDERYGWRTAVSRRHPIGEETGTPPEDDSIRCLSKHQQPEPAGLLAALTDARHGSKHPKTVHPTGGTLQG